MTGEGRRLILIRHSLPEIVPGQPASQWRLSAEGRLRCKALAEQIAPYRPDVIVASAEPKAAETAELVAGALQKPWHIATGLHEHERTNVGWAGREQFEAQVAEFFRRPDALVFGSETAEQAAGRFAAAIAAVTARHPARTLAVVAHGTVICLFVARSAGVEPFALWSRLSMPSFVVLSLPEMALVTVVERVGTG
jgi:broad specificity phosphatase PhoE